MVMEASKAKAGGRKRMEGEGILGCGGGTYYEDACSVSRGERARE